MALTLSATIRDARLQALVDVLDGGSGAGYIEFYDGVRPATGADVTTQTLLSTCVLAVPSGVVASQTLTFGTINDDVSAAGAGTASWARVYDADGGFQIDGDCGIAESGADFIFDDLAITVGALVRVTGGSIVDGNV